MAVTATPVTNEHYDIIRYCISNRVYKVHPTYHCQLSYFSTFFLSIYVVCL